MKASLEAGHVVKLPSANTIADGTAVLEPGDKIFPYIQQNLDGIITVDDEEIIVAFLDMVENHKMIVENSGLLTVAALRHLDFEGKKVVSILSGGNMDVITMSSVVQHGLIQRDRIFTVSVLLPDRPGELVRVASVVADNKGNVIRLDHNQFVSTNRQAAVELRVTIERSVPITRSRSSRHLRTKLPPEAYPGAPVSTRGSTRAQHNAAKAPDLAFLKRCRSGACLLPAKVPKSPAHAG